MDTLRRSRPAADGTTISVIAALPTSKIKNGSFDGTAAETISSPMAAHRTFRIANRRRGVAIRCSVRFGTELRLSRPVAPAAYPESEHDVAPQCNRDQNCEPIPEPCVESRPVDGEDFPHDDTASVYLSLHCKRSSFVFPTRILCGGVVEFLCICISSGDECG